EINLVGFTNLLDGAGAGGVRRVVFASSGGVVYGDPEVVPTPETAPKLPVSPYGVSKLSGEYYLRALGALRGFEGVAMRYANVFGPRQDPKSEAGVVSIFVSRLLAKQRLTVFGDGRQTRDYVFVKDVARANVLASTATLPPGPDLDAPAINIATGTQRSVLDLAQSIGQVMKITPELEFAPPRAGELLRSSLAIGKAKAVLGWAPSSGSRRRRDDPPDRRGGAPDADRAGALRQPRDQDRPHHHRHLLPGLLVHHRPQVVAVPPAQPPGGPVFRRDGTNHPAAGRL
ncbi:MAG: NAD-dependent epimerase/dehydratase family protein, partial [Gemmatimonadetes bacterium]|nr:NAD-dependent epimerase/dehydratase family protein [Gemmatimonadota bacterium]